MPQVAYGFFLNTRWPALTSGSSVSPFLEAALLRGVGRHFSPPIEEILHSTSSLGESREHSEKPAISKSI